jgi:hypothetical protein
LPEVTRVVKVVQALTALLGIAMTVLTFFFPCPGDVEDARYLYSSVFQGFLTLLGFQIAVYFFNVHELQRTSLRGKEPSTGVLVVINLTIVTIMHAMLGLMANASSSPGSRSIMVHLLAAEVTLTLMVTLGWFIFPMGTAIVLRAAARKKSQQLPPVTPPEQPSSPGTDTPGAGPPPP